LKIKILSSLFNTLTTTRNFSTAFSLRNSNGTAQIFFRDGSTMNLTWSEYWRIRDVKSTGFNVKRISDNLFEIAKGSVNLVGSSDMLEAVVESSEFYTLDFRGKTVLDVGGFQGESAVLFSAKGAKKVIIYEPVRIHQAIIRKNIEMNNVIAEVHEEGVGSVDSMETIQYDAIDLGFRLEGKGSNQTRIKITNISNVIDESNADIAKFNCEGAELSLVSVSNEMLRKVKTYIIMPHGKEIGKALIDKFEAAGFKLVKRNRTQSFLCFERRSDGSHHDKQSFNECKKKIT
jgi:FkbM family methyltransferase